MVDPRRQDALAHLHLAARSRTGEPGGESSVTMSLPAVAGQLLVRGDVSDLAFRDACSGAFGFMLPAEANTVAVDHGLTALWLGPDEWLVVSHSDAIDLAATAAGAFTGRDFVPVDVSDARTVIRVQGRKARDVLAKHCPLDFFGPSMAAGRCARSLLGRIGVLIHVLPNGAAVDLSYDLYVARSYADYAWRLLEDAGLEYGVAVDVN